MFANLADENSPVIFAFLILVLFYHFELFCLRAYRKIPKISPGAYIFQRPFWRGLHSEGLIYGEKFAFQNRLG